MNRTLLMPLVCAAALSAEATDATYTQYLTGVDSIETTGKPSAVGGTWNITDTELSKENDAVVFDTGDSGEMRLDVTAAPADTNTIVKIVVESTLEDVGELPASVTSAQTAFAVCTNSYNAWNGSAWVPLSEVPAGIDGSQLTNLLVEISYQGASNETGRKVRFTVGDTVLRTRVDDSQWVDLATTANNIAGIGIAGAGTLKTLNASVMLGVASIGDVKYGTLGDAVTAAAAGSTIEVLRPTSEDVTVTSSITIADNGKVSGTITAGAGDTVTIVPTAEFFTSAALAGKSGTYSIPVNVSGGSVAVNLPMNNKEVVGTPSHDGSTVNVTIQTATSVLEGATPDGTKALTKNLTKLRDYLNTHTNAAYIAADASSSSIEAALAATRENGLPLYQSYALGVPPETPVKPVPVASDSDSSNITLSIPGLVGKTPSGDYAITYKVGDTVQSGGAGAIKIPLSTGTGNKRVKIAFD